MKRKSTKAGLPPNAHVKVTNQKTNKKPGKITKKQLRANESLNDTREIYHMINQQEKMKKAQEKKTVVKKIVAVAVQDTQNTLIVDETLENCLDLLDQL